MAHSHCTDSDQNDLVSIVLNLALINSDFVKKVKIGPGMGDFLRKENKRR